MHSKQASETKWPDRLVIRAFKKTLYYSANTKGTSEKLKSKNWKTVKIHKHILTVSA